MTLPIFVVDSSSSTGAGLGSLVFNTSGLVAEYRRQGSATWTAMTLATATLGTWTSNGFIADGSLAGAYEVGVPNAAVASGARWVAIRLYGAANMKPVLIEIELDVVDYQDGVAFGITALPAAAAGASGGILISGTNAGTVTLGALTVTGAVALGSTLAAAGVVSFPAGIAANITGNLVGTVSTLTTYTGNTPQTGDSFARIGALGAGLTALAQASTALSTAQWTNTRAANLDNLDRATSTLSTYAGGAVASVTAPVTVGTNNDKVGYILHATGLDQITVESGLNFRQSQSIIASATAGLGGITSGVYKGAGVATARITFTAVAGERTAVTLSPPA